MVGPSGSGKSTTLRMINRLIEPSAGSIRINGEDIAALPVEALRRRIGYAIQSVGLFPHWSIADNIATVPRLLKLAEERDAAAGRRVAAMLQLDPATRTNSRISFRADSSSVSVSRVRSPRIPRCC